MKLGEARDAYLARNGFSTAAYDERWVKLKLGPIPLAFPNVASRRRAIRFHDLHHVLTGYPTTLRGEAQIGAWEIAATFPDRGRTYGAAWVLNSSVALLGLVIAPRLVVRAFRRGRRCTSLYRLGWSDALLEMEVDDARRLLGLLERGEQGLGDSLRAAARE
jgi:hypothetical protein